MIIRLLLGCCLVATGLACAEEEEAVSLGGSVSRLGYSLQYDTVRARLLGGQLAIQYVDGREIPVQVVVEVESAGLTGPGHVDLAEHGDVVGDRGADTLPALVQGDLHLDAYSPEAGGKVKGRFEATVERSGVEYTVYGGFDTRLE
jgi:hypothetical protein